MPCYQMNIMSVEFKADNLALLEKASKEKGLYYAQNGSKVIIGNMVLDTITNVITGEQQEINSLKRAYSREVVKKVSIKNGWKVSCKKDNKYVAIKY